MHIWLDTIDYVAVARAKDLGLLYGVTTNPSILAQAQEPAEEVLERLLNYFSGPLAVQVTLNSAAEMVEQGKDLFDFSPRIIVKIPVTEEGIEAIHRLSHVEIPIMATAIFEPMQAFLAAKAGAKYVVPYFSHLGDRALSICQSIQLLLTNNRFSSKLLVASLRSKAQVEKCAELGFSAVTLKTEVFKECIAAPEQTLEHLERFNKAWEKAPASNLLMTPEYFV